MDEFNQEGGFEQGSLQSDSLSSEEEGFLRGFENEDDAAECGECGKAMHDGSVARVIDDEQMHFCSLDCADDYEESSY